MNLLIKNGNVLVGENLELIENTDVYLVDGKIEKVGENLSVSYENSIDATDKFIMPGLIDLHVHLVWDGSINPVQTNQLETHDETLLRAVSHTSSYLGNGITTVRDIGSINDISISIAKAVNTGLLDGPHIITSGKTLTMTGGHDPFWANFVDGPEQALRGVREQIFKGATVIKVSATGGVYGRTEGEKAGNSELNLEELKVICNEAHKFGLKVASHAIGREGIKNSLLAGVDTIEHGHFMDKELIELMNNNNSAWVPTLFVYKQVANAEGVPSYAQKKAKEIEEIHKKAFSKFNDKVLIGAGSDAGSPSVSHKGLYNELFELNNILDDTVKTLKTATVNAGKILNKKTGIVKIGFDSDLVILKKNPLENLEHLNSIINVIKNDKVYYNLE